MNQDFNIELNILEDTVTFFLEKHNKNDKRRRKLTFQERCRWEKQHGTCLYWCKDQPRWSESLDYPRSASPLSW